MRNLQQMLSDKDEESMRRQSHLEEKLQEMEEMRKNIKSMDYSATFFQFYILVHK